MAVFLGAVIVMTALGLSLNHLFLGVKASSDNMYKIGDKQVLLDTSAPSVAGGRVDQTPDGPGVKTIVMAYACIGEKPLAQVIIPAFKDYWMQKTGEKVRFITSYGVPDNFDTIASTAMGKPVQVLLMNSGTDAINRGFSYTKWDETENKGVVYTYPQVFLVRKGNPKNIKSYADLARSDVQLLHVTPVGKTTGTWAVYGIFGSALKRTEKESGNKNYDEALLFLKEVERNAINDIDLVTEAERDFAGGLGDVVMISESRAQKQAKTKKYEVVYPPNTIEGEMIVYKNLANISDDQTAVVDAFIDFLFGELAQDAFAKATLRPTDPAVLAKYPGFVEVQDPVHVDYLGTPTEVKKKLIVDNWPEVDANSISQADPNNLANNP